MFLMFVFGVFLVGEPRNPMAHKGVLPVRTGLGTFLSPSLAVLHSHAELMGYAAWCQNNTTFCRVSKPSASSAVVLITLRSTADALLTYASGSRASHVCGLNFANGKNVGGGYKAGVLIRLPALLIVSQNDHWLACASCHPF
eukprot:5292382-Amphidinium_carterae.3